MLNLDKDQWVEYHTLPDFQQHTLGLDKDQWVEYHTLPDFQQHTLGLDKDQWVEYHTLPDFQQHTLDRHRGQVGVVVGLHTVQGLPLRNRGHRKDQVLALYRHIVWGLQPYTRGQGMGHQQ